MIGWRFDSFKDKGDGETDYDKLLELFKEILTYTSGYVTEALTWLTELDREHKLTDQNYTVSDFIEDLKDKGLISAKEKNSLDFIPTSKMEIALRKKALEDIFDQINKSKKGNHNAKITGRGDEITSELKAFEFGDKLDHLSITETLKNAYINHGIDEFYLTNEDLAIQETYYQSQTSTVLMIDISHSMILYGEDRITPAKRVAMALSELIITRYPKDTLDIIVFGNDAWQIQLKDLPYLQVGPYHTNTVAGLELAMDILRKRKNANKQIMMITDGKPTCIKKGKKYIQNSFGLDRTIVNRTLALAVKCKKLKIPVTTFMIARDPYLVQFVDAFTQANNGKAFYSSLDGLGEFLFMDYNNSKRKNKNR